MTEAAAELQARVAALAGGADAPAILPNPFNMTDLGNARRLVDRHGMEIRYCHKWSSWLVWDGRRWARDESGEVERRAKDTVASIYAEAAQEGDKERRAAIVSHAMRSESEARIRAMIALAKSEPGVSVQVEYLDKDAWLLTLENGTLELLTGTLRPHRPEDLITKLAPVAYDPAAPCPTWDAFLSRIMADRADLVEFVQRAVGYSLTADTSEQVLFFLFGVGANGKSTFLETIRTMLGDYALQMPADTLMARNDRSQTNDVARLRGSRFVAASEAEEGRRFAEVMVKQLTGGDVITARYLYSEHFEFKPTMKIFLAANHKPVIKGTDHGIWRRIRLVPFEVTIPEQERDKQLPDKLRAEMAGILNWAVQGCIQWQHNGLGAPAAVQAATAAYRADMDIMAAFLEECCIVSPRAACSVKQLYIAYVQWCEENNERPVPQRAFGSRIEERGYERYHSRVGAFWKGLGVVDNVKGGPVRHSEDDVSEHADEIA